MSLSAFYYCLVLVFVYVTVSTHHATSRPCRQSQFHPNTTLQVKFLLGHLLATNYFSLGRLLQIKLPASKF